MLAFLSKISLLKNRLMILEYLKLLRIHQWVKNIILFAGIIFGKKLTDINALQNVIIAFFLFSFIASLQYVINDYLDRKEDALHPTKKFRPLAAKTISPKYTLILTLILLNIVFLIIFMFHKVFFMLTIFYFVFNLFYSKYLKHFVIWDVISISIGFVIRAIAGSILVEVIFSEWLLLCTFMLAIFWGFSKRRGELIILDEEASKHRKILSQYSVELLNVILAIVSSMVLMSYIMYVTTHETKFMIYTIPIVVYAIFRSLYIIYIKNMGHDPTKAILTDKSVLITGFVWLLTVSFIFYN